MGVLAKESPGLFLLLQYKYKGAFLRDSDLGTCDYLAYFPHIFLPKLQMNIQEVLMIFICGAFSFSSWTACAISAHCPAHTPTVSACTG